MRQRPGMMMTRVRALPILAAMTLAACSPARDAPGAVSADEAQQLNDAAAMLDANSVDLSATNESEP